MSDLFDVVWLTASPSLKYFDRPLLKYLSRHLNIAQWEYIQSLDESSCINRAADLLNSYLQHRDSPIHLIGHGISGVVALTFARRYPSLVQSLTLLAVSAKPAMTWHSNYYMQRQILPLSREQVLAQSAQSLFGKHPPCPMKKLVNALDRDLKESPHLDSLFKPVKLPQGGVSMPLMVCGSQTDSVVHPPALQEWKNWLKPEDKLWECPDGYHFFHYFYPEEVGEQILSFWQCFNPLLLENKRYQHLFN